MTAGHISCPADMWPDIKATPKPRDGAQLRKWQRREELCRRIDWLRKLLHKEWNELLTPEVPDKPIDLVGARLKALLHKVKTDKPDYYAELHAIFRAHLVKGLKLGWFSGEIPAPIVRLQRKGSPITQDNFALTTRVAALWRHYIDFLPKISNERKILAGSVIVAAILFGGLLDIKQIRQLSRFPGLPLRYLRPWLWIDIERFDALPGGGHRGSSAHRWLLEPISGFVALTWLENYPEKSLVETPSDDKKRMDKKIWEIVSPLLETLDPGITTGEKTGNTKPVVRSITEFVQATKLAFRRHRAPMLIDVAAGVLDNRSLPEHAWLRLITGKPFGPPSVKATGVELPETGIESLTDLVESNLVLPKTKYSLLTVFNVLVAEETRQSVLRQRIQSLIRQESGNAYPILIRMMEWGSYRLSRKGGGIKGSSLRRYLASIGPPFIDFFGKNDPANLSGKELLEVYEAVRDSGRTVAEVSLRSMLCQDFHAWLAVTGAVQELDVESELGAPPPREKRVDANILSPKDYDNVIQLLEEQKKKGVLYADQAMIVIILSYRLNLRESEIFRLLHDDIRKLGKNGYLVVQEGKSDNARRVISIDQYLPLKKGRAKVEAVLKASFIMDFVVFEPGNEFQPANIGRTKELALWALRKVTGDPSIHFHHLRHSGITWKAFMLLPSIRFLPFLSEVGGEDNVQEKFLKRQAEIRRSEIGCPAPSRKLPHAIALMSGHGSPEIGIFSYAHLLDVAWLASRVTMFERRVTLEDLCKILGISSGNLRVLRTRLKPESSLDILILRKLPLLPEDIRSRLNPDFERYPPQDPGPGTAWLKVVAKALTALDEGMSIVNVCQRYSQKESDLQAWHQRALKHVVEIRGPRGGGHVGKRMGKREGLPVFRRNLTQREWEFADQIYQQLVALKEGADKDQILHWIRRCLGQGIGGHNELWFSDSNDARAFMAFSEKLGVDPKRLLFVCRPSNPSSRIAKEDDVAFWCKELGLSEDRMQVQVKGASGLSHKHGVIGFQILGADVELDDGNSAEQHRLRRPAGSPGFWTAIRFFAVLQPGYTGDLH